MNFFVKIKALFTNSPNSMSKFSKEELKQRLSPMQYKVTQENGTEPPYKSRQSNYLDEYYNTKQEGVYNCIVCFRPLFTSETKFDSGCGWPAFYDEIKEANITKKHDYTHGM